MLYVVPLDEPRRPASIDIEGLYGRIAVEDGIIYAGNYDGLFQAARLKDDPESYGNFAGRVPFVSCPAVTSERVFFGARDKTLYCLNRQDGTRVWTFTATGGIDSSPVVCGDKVIFGADTGRLYVVSLDEGRQVFTYALSGSISAGPAVADSTLLIGCEDGAVYAFREAMP